MAKKGTPKHVLDAKRTTWKIRQRAEAMSTATSTKTDRELIDEAVAEGRVRKCPTAHALGALSWPMHAKSDKI